MHLLIGYFIASYLSLNHMKTGHLFCCCPLTAASESKCVNVRECTCRMIKKSLKLLNKMLDYNIAEQRENKGDEIFRQRGRQ